MMRSSTLRVEQAVLANAATIATHANAMRRARAWRFDFGTLDFETADVIGLSPATVKREWATAKAWLYNELHGD